VADHRHRHSDDETPEERYGNGGWRWRSASFLNVVLAAALAGASAWGWGLRTQAVDTAARCLAQASSNAERMAVFEARQVDVRDRLQRIEERLRAHMENEGRRP